MLLAKAHHFHKYQSTSAKTGSNVEPLFKLLSKKLKEDRDSKPHSRIESRIASKSFKLSSGKHSNSRVSGQQNNNSCKC